MYVAGLTGGIGSGKSTVAQRLAQHGAVIIDADQVARDVVAVGSAGLGAIAARFGDHLLDPDGALDRAALAGIVFNDPEALADLNAITHPLIGETIAKRLAELADTDAIAIVDHPLLVESGAAAGYASVIVVTAPEALRVARLVETRGMDEADARARMRNQADDAQRVAVATHIVDNSGGLDELHAQVDEVFASLAGLAVAATA